MTTTFQEGELVRVLWHSQAPWYPGGMGGQTALLAPRLRDAGYDIAISAATGLQGAPQTWNGITVYGCDDWRDSWKAIRRNARLHFKDEPGLVVTLADNWPADGSVVAGFRVASLVPVEHEPLARPIESYLLTSGATPIALTRSGETILRDAGFAPLYAPHAVDTAVFHPRRREEARGELGLPAEAFIVGMVAANKNDNRKSFGEAFEAFAHFRDRHPDTLLLVHTNAAGGTNLRLFATQLGISESVIFPPADAYLAHLHTPEMIATLYASMNVLLAPSRGEGFGLPLVEAQACGVPVITTNFGAMAEIGAVGWKVGGQREYVPYQSAWWMVPNVEEITVALEAAYDEAESLSDDARARALGYGVDRVVQEHLLPALTQAAERPVCELPASLPLSSLVPLG